ncbi:delta-aminolevulinic acid dehydratase [Sulfolobales archaeon HS-7]|nr:delta-aminolevulinic acid dehydratase [Sulfolobales archaeon HS-7]
MVEYPTLRPRRLRKNEHVRKLVAETTLSPNHLVLPIFVKEIGNSKEEIESMPGVYRYPVNEELIKYIEEVKENGVNSIILFGIPSYKDEIGTSAIKRDGVVQSALKMISETFGESIIKIADECMDEYTTHGHCGLVIGNQNGYRIDNDESLKVHADIALSLAESGADIVAPSSMMDGVVGKIREKLDAAGFNDTLIMAYSAKYASVFYGPFREAATSKPAFGDRRTYQMDPRNAKESLKEIALDVEEGADIIMVKPAHTYLDVIRLVKENFPHYPLAAYHVSGEYSMIRAAGQKGWIDEKVAMMEVTYAIARAGADIIITYFAQEIAKSLREGFTF